MRQVSLLMLSIFTLITLRAQKNYTEAIQQGDDAFNKGLYKTAINKYFAAEAFDPSKKKTVKERVNRVFDKVDSLRNEADESKKQAIRANDIARKEGKNALVRQLSAKAEVLRNDDPSRIEESVLLALQSLKLNYTPEAEEVLRKDLALLPSPVFKIPNEKPIVSYTESDYEDFETFTDIVVSKDNKYLARGSSYNKADVWETESGKKVFTAHYEKPVSLIALDPSSKYLVTAGKDGAVVLWDFRNVKEVSRFNNFAYRSQQKSPLEPVELTFSPDGKSLLIVRTDRTAVLIDVPSLQARDTLKFSLDLNDIKFSADGTLIAGKTYANRTSTIQLINIQTGKLKHQFIGAGTEMNFAFDPQGKYLAVVGFNQTVLWDIQSGKEVEDFFWEVQHDLIGFSQDGNFLWTVSKKGEICKWNVSTKRDILRFKAVEDKPVSLISLSADGEFIVTCDYLNLVRLWSASDGLEVGRFIHDDNSIVQDETSGIQSLSFIDGSKFLATANGKGDIKIWKTRGYYAVSHFSTGDADNSISFSGDDKLLLTGASCNSCRVNIWNIKEGMKLFQKTNPHAVENGALLSQDSKYLFSTSYDSVWKEDWKSKKILSRMKLAGNIQSVKEKFKTVAFTTDGSYLFKKNINELLLWKIDSAAKKIDLKLPNDLLNASFSPAGTLLLTIAEIESSDTVTIEVFDLRESKRKILWQYPATIPFYAISFDDKFIAVPGMKTVYEKSDFDGRINVSTTPTSAAIVFNIENKRQITHLNFPNKLSSLAFSPDGKFLAGGQENGMISVFNIASGREVARITGQPLIKKLLFSPQQNYIAFTVEGKEGVKVWQWQIEKLMKEAFARLSRNFTFKEWQEYLRGNPYELVCPGLPPHSSLLAEARNQAWFGNIKTALSMTKHAVQLGDSLKTDPKTWVMQQAAKGVVDRGLQSARKGYIKQAVDSFGKAERLDPTMSQITLGDWNDLAWQAATRNEAKYRMVIVASNNAVKLAPQLGAVRDTRGLVRALNGNYKGAIEDFEYYIKWAKESGSRIRSVISKREDWIKDLKAGENPFDEETLNDLVDDFYED